MRRMKLFSVLIFEGLILTKKYISVSCGEEKEEEKDEQKNALWIRKVGQIFNFICHRNKNEMRDMKIS